MSSNSTGSLTLTFAVRQMLYDSSFLCLTHSLIAGQNRTGMNYEMSRLIPPQFDTYGVTFGFLHRLSQLWPLLVLLCQHCGMPSLLLYRKFRVSGRPLHQARLSTPSNMGASRVEHIRTYQPLISIKHHMRQRTLPVNSTLISRQSIHSDPTYSFKIGDNE